MIKWWFFISYYNILLILSLILYIYDEFFTSAFWVISLFVFNSWVLFAMSLRTRWLSFCRRTTFATAQWLGRNYWSINPSSVTCCASKISHGEIELREELGDFSRRVARCCRMLHASLRWWGIRKHIGTYGRQGQGLLRCHGQREASGRRRRWSQGWLSINFAHMNKMNMK